MKKRLFKNLNDSLSLEERDEFLNSFDIVGDIAIIRQPYDSQVNVKIEANAIMNRHRNVKTVLLQTSPIGGYLRLRFLRYVAGENKTKTIHKEFDCLFSVDLKKCYFSPRLSHERMRIAKMVAPKEIVINMFAGVGCFSILIAKYAKPEKVFSIDINPAAFQFQQENIRLNRVYAKVKPLKGDSEKIILNSLQNVADRVLMTLPEKASEYLPSALLALNKSGGWIHYYSFEHAKKNESPEKKIKLKVKKELEKFGVTFEIPSIRVIRTTGPNWFQLVADIRVIGKRP